MCRHNVQHGQRRRIPWSIRLPVVILTVLTGVLAWELIVLFGGA